MKLQIAAVGRLRSGPEASLVSDYLARTGRTGMQVGIGPVEIREVDARKGGTQEEARLLAKATAGTKPLVVLDERGTALNSPGLAARLEAWRDHGHRQATFVIGGADGVASTLRERADLVLSLGPMVWPHMLVRVMLAEQLYRSVSILAGSPYHRT
ncbi:MAG: 23S rRNA (pseudouridine(1915)-N(3))-methyltransferase RlmH [Boseongicola sp. SB0676_bin_33]|uniref:Ribosomal RNA large subunit methyltransferase H n=1 Tax=Boseongicola sp. SB0664_bin_43 TaxID=2604844 RepID=A0A6B0XYH2_9RHOB|nr:23S rRNA (pseudouridine(1915)-N(3))-methyltransferase RlmH [Boseongicola sp. SB0664_bin_43]MYF90098.1 23S rRNA (pseudouridine(1915)-N(3))-methyltransferase RlmH [Boseongicola sp. SB0676_bin_33]